MYNTLILPHLNYCVLCWGQGWAKSDSKLQALCPDLDHQAFQAFWGNSRKLMEKGILTFCHD